MKAYNSCANRECKLFKHEKHYREMLKAIPVVPSANTIMINENLILKK